MTMEGAYVKNYVTPPHFTSPWIKDAQIPSVSPGFLLVKVHAASLNPVDKYIAAGFFGKERPIFQLPRSVGSDFSGEVVEVGDGSEITYLTDDGEIAKRPAKVGDLVFGDGIQGSGTFNQYATVLATQAVLKPESLSHTDAAALPLASLTAYQSFLHIANMSPSGAKPVGPGSKVLVLGGSGGVGSHAVQIAKALGAHVAATSSDTELLKSLGADIAINYREEDWGEKLKGEEYDFIFATVDDRKPSPAHERAMGVLKSDGCFIALLGKILPEEPPAGDRIFKFVLTKSTEGKDLAAILKMVLGGKVKAVINKGEVFPFSEEGWKSLMNTSNSGRSKGKLVMQIA